MYKKNQEEGKHFFRSLNKHTEYVKAQKESASHDSAMCLCSCLGKKLGEKNPGEKVRNLKKASRVLLSKTE